MECIFCSNEIHEKECDDACRYFIEFKKVNGKMACEY